MLKKSIPVLLVISFIILMPIGGIAEGNASGKNIFTQAKCNMCHSISSQGIEAKKKSNSTPDLSNVGATITSSKLKSYLKKESELNEKKHLVAFKGEEADFETLVSWLLTLKTTK
jgi:cytochrome c553